MPSSGDVLHSSGVMKRELPVTRFLTPYGDQPRITKAEGEKYLHRVRAQRVPGSFGCVRVLDWLQGLEKLT